jgi:hypothetical protein
MAGDWIKMRVDLFADPAVVRIRRATGLDADSVVGKLHRLWSWADVHTSDGTAHGLDAQWVDELVGCVGFAAAMASTGWLSLEGDGVQFVNFERHNGQPAKVRALRKTRMERLRGAARATDAPPEKRREEKSRVEDIPAAPVPTSKPPAASGSRAKAAVSWSADAGWQGITDADRSEWAAAYPGAVIDQELAKATAWLRANPKRCGKRNWRRFLVGWLQRCQDKGGTNRTPGERPGVTGPAPVPMDKRRYWRGKAGRSMTDDEYQAWMAAQARDGPTSDGASVGDLLARTLTEGTR